MPTRHSLLFLVAAVSPIVVAQSSISSSLSSSLVTVPTSISISLTTIRTTVTVTSTSSFFALNQRRIYSSNLPLPGLLPPTTVTDPASTTTFFVSPLPPETSTTTILLPSSSSSSNDLSNVPNTPVPSGTLVPPPASSGSDVLYASFDKCSLILIANRINCEQDTESRCPRRPHCWSLCSRDRPARSCVVYYQTPQAEGSRKPNIRPTTDR